MSIILYEHQRKALDNMKRGCILCGGVGSGKSLTAISYYYLMNGGDMSFLSGDNYFPMGDPPMDLYIITTAKKRDTLEWERELSPFLLSTKSDVSIYSNKVVVDSWNNVGKYAEVENAFFIFDEQRVVGSGAWVKSFLKIAKKNMWILLSATPGDCWNDYIPVFVANGFYKNRSEFIREHIVYSRFSKFPKVDKYLNTGKLMKLRNSVLVTMDFQRKTVQHHTDIYTSYDVILYKEFYKNRWDVYNQKPIENASDLCYLLRKLVNSDASRGKEVIKIFSKHKKVIIFYNFDYELEILKSLDYGSAEVAEWNGHKHQAVPTGDRWVYLVQYTAGCEGWNCITSDTIIFYSQSYSYKVMCQASGRIDRLNTPYSELYYYHLKSRSGIDMAIDRALKNKKTFNESRYIGGK